MKDEHVRDEPVKGAVEDVAEDVTQDVAEDVSGAAEDGSVKVFVVARAMFHPPQAFPRRHVKDALAHTSSLTDLTRNTRVPHFTPQHWLLCLMGLY